MPSQTDNQIALVSSQESGESLETPQKRAFLHAATEYFFAILPLAIAWSNWPAVNTAHPGGFWSSAEPSLIACVLYGLCLARLAYGTILRAHMAKPNLEAGKNVAAFGTAWMLVPLSGVICTSILLTHFFNSNHNPLLFYLQIINFLFATCCYFLLAFIGLSHVEKVE
jgi:hypothetical protein